MCRSNSWSCFEELLTAHLSLAVCLQLPSLPPYPDNCKVLHVHAEYRFTYWYFSHGLYQLRRFKWKLDNTSKAPPASPLFPFLFLFLFPSPYPFPPPNLTLLHPSQKEAHTQPSSRKQILFLTFFTSHLLLHRRSINTLPLPKG